MADLETDTSEVRPSTQMKKALQRVNVRITKFGAGKVSSGVHVQGEGDIYCDKDDILEVTEDVGAILESRGFAEIVPDPEPPQAAEAS